MKRERKEITLRGYVADRVVKAVMVGERVAVHPQYLPDEGWGISDPVTGRAYSFVKFTSERAAIRKASLLVDEFGSNPLKGSIIDGKSDKWIREPHRCAEIREFFYSRPTSQRKAKRS